MNINGEYLVIPGKTKNGRQRRVKDLTGKTFGKQTVIKFDSIINNKAHWQVRCECGSEYCKSSDTIQRTSSCGCLQKEKAATHNMTKTRTYKSWQMMKQRCYNKKAKDYKLYGALGITVCKEWLESFETFLNDMGERPNKMSLDRIDSSKGYSPNNCRWATSTQQIQEHRRITKLNKDKVKEIRKLQGLKAKDVKAALNLEVSERTIRDVLNFKTWTNV